MAGAMDGCVSELCELVPDAASPQEAVRTAARQRLETARSYGLQGPPFCPHVLASLLNIKTRPDRLLPKLDAMIVPDANGNLTIVWNDARPRKRTNFSVAHEIGHTLFPSCARMVRQRQRHPGSYHDQDDVEVLCDIAAAEFLMPFEEFRQDLKARAPTIETVLDLSDRYQASYEAISIRMQFVDERPLAIFVAQQFGRVSPPRLRMVYSPKNTEFDRAFPNVRLSALEWIPAASIAYDALNGPVCISFSRECETWPAAPAVARFRVEAMRLPVPEKYPPRVLVILRPIG